MRFALAILLAASLLAGCAQKGGAPADATDATPSPTGTGVGAGTGAPTAPASPTPTPSSAATSASYDASYMGHYPHDFGGEPATLTLRVPVNAPKVDVDLGYFTMPSMSGECDTGGASIALEPPAGASGAARMSLTPGSACATAKNWSNVQLAPGAWTLRFEGKGQGNGFATIGPHGNKTNSSGPAPFHAKRTHDHLNAEETQKVTIPEGAIPGSVTLRFTAGDATSGCFSTDASIQVLVPDGRVLATLAMPPTPTLPDTCPPAKRVEGVAFTPGVWKVLFSGTGSVTGTVTFDSSS